MTGRGSRAAGGCAGTAIAAGTPKYLWPLEQPRGHLATAVPGHTHTFPLKAEQKHSKAAKSHFPPQSHFPPLPRIGKERAVSVFKMQIYLGFFLAVGIS